MKHKVKVTVIDKSYIQNCSNSIARTLIRVLALAIMLAMNLFLS